MVGETLSHYQILAEVGRGGMGVVYRAKDTKLDRLVAIKVMRANVSDDPIYKQRFLREARAVSRLQNPHICTIHEIAETEDGRLFLVMDYYEGETLARKILCGPLPLKEMLGFMEQLLDGLECAHQAGIMHRDIKPANMMISKNGELRILDFGLAKPTDETMLTDPGLIVGTLAYMAPEQARNEEVDHRADLWAAGTVAYEMLTGNKPFSGTNSAVIVAAIIQHEPPIISHVCAGVPGLLDDILRKALAKDKHFRYQSAADFRRDMQALARLSGEDMMSTTVSVLPPEPVARSVVVLPFVNQFAGGEPDYFSEGLTDEIITALSHVQGLRVMARSASNRLSSAADPKPVIRELNVRYLLEGTIRRRGERLRVNAKLVDVFSESIVWAEHYDGSMDDVFSIEETLAGRIVEALKGKLTPEEQKKLARRPIPDVRAYEFYLKARYEILNYSREALERAQQHLRAGEKIVGENILILSSLGQVYWQFVNAGISSDVSYLQKARKCAERILHLDPESVHGHRLVGLINIHEGDMQEAARRLKRALDLDPNDVDTLGWLIGICTTTGKPSAAAPLVQRLLELDPVTPSYRYTPGLVSLAAGDFAAAVGPFSEAARLEPSNPMSRFLHGQALALSGQIDECARVFDELANDLPQSSFAKLGQFYKHAALRQRECALKAATPDLKAALSGDPYYCWNLAQGYALLGEEQEAVHWLERGAEVGFINYPLLAKFDPFLENIRSSSRCQTLLDDLERRWKAFEV